MCECCQRARESPGYTMFDPACQFCGARLIWKIQRKPIPRDQKIERCRKVLDDWLKYGHSEEEIRRLAKLSEIPTCPAPELSTSLSTGRGKRGG